jgi:hypothetical protein
MPVLLASWMLLTTLGAAAHPLDVWHWRNPLPQGNALNAVTYANGLYVAVGALGTILTSPDGTNWSRRASGTFEQLNDIVFANDQFVAVGVYGAILTSADGQVWMPQYGGTFFTLSGVTYGNGLYVAVGLSNTILTSADGIMWVSRSSGPISLRAIAFGNGQFVATGSAGVLSSSDGVNWFRRSSYGQLGSVAFGNGIFVAGETGFDIPGSIMVSADGAEWLLKYNTGRQIRDITYANGTWLVVAKASYNPEGFIYASNDANTWTLVHSNPAPTLGITFGGNGFVATSENGSILLSHDANTWVNPLPATVTPWYGWRDVAYTGNQFVALGLDSVSFSSDGAAWTSPITVTNLDEHTYLYSIAYGNGLYVAGSEYRTVWVSSDGITWTNPAPELSVRPYSALVNDIIYANGLFVAAAGYEGSILTSSNGINWRVINLATNEDDYIYWQGVAYGNGTYVAVAPGRAAASPDTVTWQTIGLGWEAYFRSVAFGNGKFVASGQDGFWLSGDGLDWVRSALHDSTVRQIAFGAGYFVAAVGYDEIGSVRRESFIWTSSDGVNWTRHRPFTERALTAVAFGNGSFVVVGTGGTILQSDPLVSLSLSMGVAPTLRLSGPKDRWYDLECSDAAGAWHPLSTVLADSMPFSVSDTTATNGLRLYRALLRP